MPSRTLALSIQIDSKGTPKTLGDLQLLSEAIKRSELASLAAARAFANQSQATTQLASTLGVSYKNAQQFATSIGLTTQQASEAANRLRQLDGAGASTTEKFRALKNEFGLTKSAFIDLNGSFNQNTQAQQRLAQTLGVNLSASKSFAQGLGLSAEAANGAVSRYRELGAVGATLGEKQRVLTQELGLSKTQFEAVAAAALQTRAGMASVAAIAGGAATGIGAIAQKGVAEFTAFDSQLRTFGVIAEASPQKVAAIREEIQRLGTTTQKTPKEIADLSIELTKAGFTADQVKAGLGGVVLASQATGEDLARTGEVIGNVINQYGLAASDTNRIADLLVVTSNKSASGINDLGEALAYTGTAAKESGQSLEDTLLALGQLANAGIKGSAAGTGLAEALRRLKLASANASTELADLKTKGSKTAVAAFNKIDQAVRGTNGQLLPLPQILKNLKGGLEGVSQVDKDLINNALFGVQGGRVVQSLMSSNTEQLKQLEDGLKNADGAAKKAGEALSQGPAAGLKQLQAATSVALVRIGELVSGPLGLLIDVSQALVGGFNALPGPLQAVVVGVTGFVGILAAATAAIAAYNLAQGQTIVQETLAAAATVRNTAIKGASAIASRGQALATSALAGAQALATVQINSNTLATGANLIAAKALALAQGILTAAKAAYAAATGTATIATVAGTGATAAAATTATGAAAAFGALGTAIGGLLAPLLAIAAPLAALGAIAGLTGIIKYTEQLGDVQSELDRVDAELAVVNESSVKAQTNLKAAIDATTKAKEQGRSVSAAERADAAKAIKLAEGNLNLLKQQLESAKAIPEQKAGFGGFGKDEADAQNNARQAQISSIENSIKSIERQKTKLEENLGIQKQGTEAAKQNTKATESQTDAKKKLEEALKSVDEISKN